MIQSADDIRAALEEELNLLGDDLIRDTARIISYETVSGGNPEQEAKYRQQIPACMEWLKGLAEEHGFAFKHWDHEVAEIEWATPPSNGEKRPVFGIASHIDVVTPAGKWQHPPFGGEIEDGILYGRGIQDDKGPLIQTLYGMIAAKRAGITPPCDVRIIIGTREETGDWSDIEKYVRLRGAPDYGYTPDAEFPVIIGEKGMMNVRLVADWPAVEPNPETQMQFVSMKGGERTNIIPSLTEVLLRFPREAKHEVMKELVRETTRYTVENPGSNVTLVPNNDEEAEKRGEYEALVSFLGKNAHSSTPDAGYNAIRDGLKFFSDIETMPPTVRAFIQFLAFMSEGDDGRNFGIDVSHGFVGDTTAAITLLEVGPTGGMGSLNIRPTMGLTVESVIRQAEEAAAAFGETTGLKIRVEPEPKRLNACYLDPEQDGVGEFLRSLRTAYEQVVGEDCDLVSIGGTTYAKALPNCCAFGPVLIGTDTSLAHQADEHLAVDSIKRNALIYGLSIALMCQP